MDRSYIGVDTETTGLEALHGRRVFFLGTWKETASRRSGIKPDPIPASLAKYKLSGAPKGWEWKVNPLDRTTYLPRAKKREVACYLEDSIPVFYHALFDFTMLAMENIYFNFTELGFCTTDLRDYCSLPSLYPKPGNEIIINCPRFEEVQFLAHTVNNKGPKDLKSLSIHLLHLSDSDEKKLRAQVNTARRLVRKYFPDWQLGVNPKGDSEVAADYWLPKALYLEWERQSKKKGGEHAKELLQEHASFKTCLSDYGLLDNYRTLGCWWTLYHSANLQEEEGYTDIWNQYERHIQCFPAVMRMQAHGLNLISTNLKPLRERLLDQSAKLKAKNDALMTRRLGRPASCSSPKDLIQLLYTEDGFNFPVRRRSGKVKQPSTAAPALIDMLVKDIDLPTTTRPVLAKKFIDRQISYNQKEHGTDRDNVGYKSYATGAGFLNNYLARAIPDYACPHDVENAHIIPAQDFSLPLSQRFPPDTRLTLFPGYKQTGTAWTRLASENPNGQNVSKKPEIPSRLIFGPRPGFIWLAIDYSQLEIRLFARAANAKDMLDALRRGEDLHTFTACAVYDEQPEAISSTMRREAKAVNFGIIYGMGAEKLLLQIGSADFMDTYNQRFPSVKEFMERTKHQVRTEGWVETLFGCRLWVAPDPEHKGPNGVIQGTAGEIVKEAMIELNNDPASPCNDPNPVRIIANFHDELLFQLDVRNESPNLIPSYVKNTAQRLMTIMSRQGDKIGAITPVECDVITTNWKDAESLPAYLERMEQQNVKRKKPSKSKRRKLRRRPSLN